MPKAGRESKWRGGGSNTQFEANNKFSMPIHDESSRQLKLEAEPHKKIQNNFQFIVVAFGKKRGPNILLLVRTDEKINSRFNFIIHSMGVAAQTQIQLELRFKIYEIEMDEKAVETRWMEVQRGAEREEDGRK
ncbi:hypothetical protein V8G54_006698 [Vigna mungo]|uniref:Uncharacterized protein n=1 Tax=Vigna mungo TaxID=3915 RepID=A0AAQ3NZH0_VIGMU